MRLDEEVNSLRVDINKFRIEIRQRLEVIENEVNKQVALNYNRTIIDYVSETSHDLLANMKCDKPKEEAVCKKRIAGIQDEYLTLLKSGKFSESINSLETAMEKMKMAKANFENNNLPDCVKCIDNEAQLMKSNMQLLRQLRLIESPAVTLAQNTATVASFDAVKTSDSILNPLSHRVRLQILQSIYKGENRFSDLSNATGLEGGQLLYHVRKLKDSDYLDQFESKDYYLSPKGMKTLVVLAQLSKDLN
jgi:hypothetical protein